MKNSERKGGLLKIGMAWYLMVAFVAGNILLLTVINFYGAERIDCENAGALSVGHATLLQAMSSHAGD